MSEIRAGAAPGALSAAGRRRGVRRRARSRCPAGSGSATSAAVRKLALLVVLALIWEGYARWLNNPLLFPTFTATLAAFAEAIASGVLPGTGADVAPGAAHGLRDRHSSARRC